MQRRSLLAAALAAPAVARAAEWPNGAIRIISCYTPGGANDLLGRFAADVLGRALGVPCVVENRPGAGGNLGMETVARAAPDGQTLVVAAGAAAINQTLYKNLSFDLRRDFAPVTLLGAVPNVLGVHPGLPPRSTAEFIAWAKAQGNGVAYASAGIGTVPHLAMALLLNAIGAQGVHVPFRGSAPAVTEVMSGRIPALFENLPPMATQLRGGNLRGLAISTAQRHPDWPELPTLAETIPGFEILAWQGLMAPAGTPPAIVARIATEIGAAVRSEAGQAALGRIGALPRPMTPAEFSGFVATEIDKWAAAVRLSGATVE